VNKAVEGEMGFSGLGQAAGTPMGLAFAWFGNFPTLPAILKTGLAALLAAGAVALAFSALLRRRRLSKDRREREARLRSETQVLKERLRFSLSEPISLFAGPAEPAPIPGASEGFFGDIEAAEATVLREAGGHRAKAKELLRQRVNGEGNGSAGARLNGSGAACWRQLGALSLLDNASDATVAYARAADLAPEDAQAQMLSGILHLRQGNLSAAEAAFRRQIKLSGAPHAGVSRYRGYTLLGDVHAGRGEAEEAIGAYREAQREIRALMESAQAPWLQRDLSVTCDRIGDTLASQGALDEALGNYLESLAIVEGLARHEPDNLVWLRDLSVSHDRVGDVLDRKGDYDGALENYRRGLLLAEKLASGDPGNGQWQWDLSVSHERVGDMLSGKGRTEEALKSYRRGLAIAETLVARDPTNIGWRRDLAVSYHKIGSLEAGGGNFAEARELLEKGRAIIARLERIASYQAQWRSDLAKFDSALQGLDG
jgi:tetratricopeptide (TPR) repeat protein